MTYQPHQSEETANKPVACDNPSGTFCADCRATGLWHCQHPDECGGMKPMQHHADCASGVPEGLKRVPKDGGPM